MEYSSIDNQVLLVGSFTHQLDAKRRLIFPVVSVWRNLAALIGHHRYFSSGKTVSLSLFKG